VKRWQHEEVLDRMQARLERMPEAMSIRRQTVEHPFGTLKAWMGSTHFLMKTLAKVKTEMSLHVLAYNLKRMVSVLGVGPPAEGSRSLTPHTRPCAPSRHAQNSAHHPHAGNSVFTHGVIPGLRHNLAPGISSLRSTRPTPGP
jgi:hypothetical protein